MTRLDTLEGAAVDLVAKVAPWCAPIPTAFLVGRATVLHLAWPVWVGVVAAVIVESLGLATTTTALTLYEYNRSRRKVDNPAPFWLAALLVVVYFLTATGLTVLLDIAPELSVYAPGIFPILSLCGVGVLALRSDHKRWLAVIAQEKQDRRVARAAARQVNLVSNLAKSNTLEHANQTRQAKRQAAIDELLTFYRDNPLAGLTEAGRSIGKTRQTVDVYLEELEQSGRIRRNGRGVEILEGRTDEPLTQAVR